MNQPVHIFAEQFAVRVISECPPASTIRIDTPAVFANGVDPFRDRVQDIPIVKF